MVNGVLREKILRPGWEFQVALPLSGLLLSAFHYRTLFHVPEMATIG